MALSSKAKGFQKFKSVKRKAMVVSSQKLVDYRTFDHAEHMPLVIEPAIPDLDLPGWIRENRDDLRQRLHRHGALLFRGFKVEGIETFENAVRGISGEPLKYTERSSPRHAVHGRVYTSTDYPPNEIIFLHNEQSYNLNWCRVISFYCPKPAEEGGQTPIADTRRLLARIDPEIRERFRKRGYMYMRNFGDGFGLNWPVTFQTEDREEVARYCRANHIEFEWKENNRLRTRQTRPAIHRHPETGELVWFNHATFFHITTSPERIRANLMAEFGEQDLPNHTFYGDGQPIEAEVMEQLRAAYLAEKVVFDWQAGDIMILDNMLSSHGREAFKGERSVLVAMSEPTENTIDDLGKGV